MALRPERRIISLTPQTRTRRPLAAPGVIKAKALSPLRLKRMAIESLRAHGSIYVTGETFSQATTDRILCINYNSGIGKTIWASRELLPDLKQAFGPVFYVDAEALLGIRELLRKDADPAAATSGFEHLSAAISMAEQDSVVVIIDECHWLFPLPEHRSSGREDLKIFSFGTAFAHQQIGLWRKLGALKRRGIKLVFISWLHPKDLSLAGLPQSPFRMVRSSTLIELKSHEDDSDG